MLHRYQSRQALAEALSTGVAAILAGGIATRGSASLAVSGGSTPALFLQTLAKTDIAWSSVVVTLVDERCVPDTHERSNAGFLRRHLLQGPAAAARFLPLYTPGEVDDALAVRLGSLPRPLDAVVLGMGADGHTASFFPGAANLDEALDPANPRSVIAIEAPGAAEPRLSLTLPRLTEARFLALHIEGGDKLGVFAEAGRGGPPAALPVRAVLRAPRERPLEVFWAPLPTEEAQPPRLEL